METGGKNRDEFHCMQMALVMGIFHTGLYPESCMVPVRAVKRYLRSRNDCVRYLLSPILCFIKRCYLMLIVLRDILICSVILVCFREEWPVLGLS